MKPADRHAWILDYIHKRTTSLRYTVDVTDRYFVDEYIEATGAKCKAMIYGADKCPQLGRDLSTMFKAGKLTRSRTGLGDMHSMGFPAWVWCYTIPPINKDN